MRAGCGDAWSWDPLAMSPNVRLGGPNRRAALFHPKWSNGTAAVRGTRALDNGRHYWELRLSKRIFGTSMMIGIGTDMAELHADCFTNLIGNNSESWGLSHKGHLWHAGQCTSYTEPFRENVPTTIGVMFDGAAGTLTYYKDGRCLGVAFRNLQDVGRPLYPMASSTAAKTEMVLVSTKRDFGNLQDRCRDVIVERVQSRDDLDRLLLPTPLKQYLAEALLETNRRKPVKPIKKLLCNAERFFRQNFFS